MAGSLITSTAAEFAAAHIPGARFHTGAGGANALRLAFSLYEPDELIDAASRLGGVIREGM